MLKRFAKTITSVTLTQCKQKRNISLSANMKSRVTIIGMGGIGQALSILLKINPRVTLLHLYDVKDVQPFVVDLSHIDRYSITKGFKGEEQLDEALSCTNLLVITAGIMRKDPKQSRDDLIDANADIVGKIIETAAVQCPKAMIVIITNPVNSLVPMAAEILKKYNVYDPKRLFGLTYLDFVRTKTFIGDAILYDPSKVKVPVIGGHSPATITPILSECSPILRVEDEILNQIIKCVKFGGDRVIMAHKGKCSAQLATAYAAKCVCDAILDGLINNRGANSVALIASNLTEAPFFSSQFYLDSEGIKEILPLPDVTDEEKGYLEQAVICLQEDIKKGVEMAKKKFSGPPKKKKEDC